MQIRTSLEKHKSILIFCGVILLFGIITGIIFYMKQDINTKETLIVNLSTINNNVFDIKNLFIHLIIILVIIATAFTFLGIPALILALFFESLSIGFIIPIFISIFKLKSLFSLGIYIILVKAIYLLILIALLIILIKFTKQYLIFIQSKKTDFFSPLKKMFLLCVATITNDLIIYFAFNKLLIFLLK